MPLPTSLLTPRLRPTRLRVLLICVVLGLQLPMLAALMLGLRQDTTDLFESSAGTALERIAGQVGERTTRHLDAAEDVLASAARLVTGGLLDSADDAVLERYFATQLQSHPWLAGIMLGRADGSFLHVRRLQGGFESRRVVITDGERRVTLSRRDAALAPLTTREDSRDTLDPRERPWYRRAREVDGIIWTDPYVFSGEDSPGISAALSLVRPTTSGAQADAGVLGVDLNLQSLSSLVADLPGAGAGSAVIVDAERRVIAYSDATRLERAIDRGRIPTLEDLGDEALSRLFERSGASVDGGGRSAIDAGTLIVDGERRLVVALAFPSTSSIVGTGFEVNAGAASVGDWRLLAQVPGQAHTAGIGSLFTRNLLLLVALLVLPALLAVVAVVWLTRPVYRIHRDATIDPLTGACNRVEFERRVRRRLGNLRRGDSDEGLVLVAFDLDGFKRVNDDFGHAAGDAVLVAFVERLTGRLRASDVVGRLGGDEFAAAMDIDTDQDLLVTIERLRAGLVAEPVVSARGVHTIGVTAGIARHAPHESAPETLQRADLALIGGKARGKNRTYLAPPPLESVPSSDRAESH